MESTFYMESTLDIENTSYIGREVDTALSTTGEQNRGL
jgi:hypothetical protein